MTPRTQKKGRIPPSPEPLRGANPHAAGSDVHAPVHGVAVPPDHVPAPKPTGPGAGGTAPLPPPVRKGGTCTADLELPADWLQHGGITSVALQSTGVDWIPRFERLERRGFQVDVVDPRQTKHAPGRPKSDVLDCQCIQRRPSYGLLPASFRPADQVVVLRAYLRQRQLLIRYAGQHVQQMQKALEPRNGKLAEVGSDGTGVTGLAIIPAIGAGERHRRQLAALRHERCKRTEAERARALHGNGREQHRFARKQALELYQG